MQENLGTFGDYLQQMINKKGMKNSEVYTAANLTKQYFSKLLKGKVTPSKTKVLSLAVALQLNMDESDWADEIREDYYRRRGKKNIR